MTNLRERYPDYSALFEAIRNRPGTFLAKQSIYGLDIFLHGIWFAENLHEIDESERLGGFDFEQFEKWVELQYNVRHLAHNSLSLAAELAGDNEAGFDF